MDVKNRLLLYELSKNGRATIKSLAQKIRLSQPSTLHRLEKLRTNSTLNIHAVLDTSKIGLRGFRMYVQFHGTTLEEEELIMKWLYEQEAVTVLAACTGGIDVAIMSWVQDEQAFYEFIIRLKKAWGIYIREIATFTYLKTLHFARSYLVDKNSEYLFSTGLSKPESIDELDMAILKQIGVQGRISNTDIAKALTTNVHTIIHRIKAMQTKKIISGYGLSIDLKSIEKEYYKLNFTLKKPLSESEQITFCETLKGIIYVDITLGAYDLELNVEVTNTQEVHNIIDAVKEHAQGIDSISIFQIKKYHKLSFITS